MDWLKAYLALFAGALVGIAGGAGIGYALGTHAPGFYRAWAPNADSPDFNALEYAIGLGSLQGLGVGLGVSLLLIAILCWRDVQMARLKTPATEAQTFE